MMMNNPTTLDLRPAIPWTLDSNNPATFQEFRNIRSTIIFPPCADSLILTLGSFVRGSYIEIGGERFTIKNHIGNGTYGFVASVESPGPLGKLGNTSYILKTIKCSFKSNFSDTKKTLVDNTQKYRKQIQNVIAECVNQQIISKFDNLLAPRIIKIAKKFEAGAGSAEDTFYIIMEFLEGADAKNHLNSQTTDDGSKDAIITMMRSLAKFTRKAYDKYHFIHGDMKPDNLFRCNDGTIRYIDFGFSNLKFDILNKNTQIIAMPDFALVSHPTRDLTMLAVYLNCCNKAIINNIPELTIGFDAILKDAICDTSDSAIRGDVPVHAPHYLGIPGSVPPLNPPNRRLLDVPYDMSWENVYSYLWYHNNINATPENVLLVAFPDAIAVPLPDAIAAPLPNIAIAVPLPPETEVPPQPTALMNSPSPDQQAFLNTFSGSTGSTGSTGSPAGAIIPQHNDHVQMFSASNTESPKSTDSPAGAIIPQHNDHVQMFSASNTESTNTGSGSTNISPIVGGFKKLTSRFLKKRSNKKKRNGHNKFIKSIKSIKNRQQTRSKRSKSSKRRNNRNKTRKL
jgi:hypothetical protein